MHVYIFSGWLGRGPSAGMYALVGPLRALGAEVEFLSWRQADYALGKINGLPPAEKAGLIGFSQGAVNPGWIDKYVKRPIDLSVCYDPRGGTYGLMQNGSIPVRNHRKLINYHNAPWTWTMASYNYSGPGVETYEIVEWHVTVQGDWNLHRQTIAAFTWLSRQP